MGKKSELDIESEKVMVNLLLPKTYDPEKLERIGSQEDGGYIVPKNVIYNHHICLGVGNNVDFENEMVKYVNGRIICVDHTIQKLPQTAHVKLEHFRKKVTNKDGENSICLETIVKSLSDTENISLKMDIEGWEFPVLYHLPDYLLEKFELIVLEMHCIGNYGDRGGGDQGPIKDPRMKLKCLQKLSKYHDLIHISPNKIVGALELKLGFSFPYVVELTYVKKIKPDRNTNHNFFYPTKLDTCVGPKSIEAMQYLTHIDILHQYRDMKIILDISKFQSVPKTVHLAWKNKDIWNNESPLILNGIANMKLINPDYKFQIHDDNDIDKYLLENLDEDDYKRIEGKHIVEKCDLWRLLKIYNEGGIYVDIDRYCNIPFNDIITPGTKCLLPTCDNLDFSQDIMISCKNNPIFKTAINMNLNKRKGGSNIYGLGAPIYMNAITQEVFGIKYDQNPGVDKMETMRILLNKSEHYSTYQEKPPHDTIIFKYNKSTYKTGNGVGKHDFYKEQNVNRWNQR